MESNRIGFLGGFVIGAILVLLGYSILWDNYARHACKQFTFYENNPFTTKESDLVKIKEMCDNLSIENLLYQTYYSFTQ